LMDRDTYGATPSNHFWTPSQRHRASLTSSYCQTSFSTILRHVRLHSRCQCLRLRLTQHEALLKTCEEALSSDSTSSHPSVLVFYTHHRPHLANRDMNFFTKARERRWQSEEILSETFPVRSSSTACVHVSTGC